MRYVVQEKSDTWVLSCVPCRRRLFCGPTLTTATMASLVYLRLIGFTAGTLLQLFWMVVILGYRRQRNFERVFFFLSLALFLFYAGSLLALNTAIYYLAPPNLVGEFAITIVSL